MSKVTYTGASEAQINWGGNDDPRMVLIVGHEYEVESEEVHAWHTKIRLKGIDKVFNSAYLKPVI